MAELGPIPSRVPLVDSRGLLNRNNWHQWFEALLRRVGNIGDQPSNADLAAMTETDTPGMVQARLAHIEQRLANLETLLAFREPQAAPAAEVDAFVEGRALLDQLQGLIRDVEALTAFQEG